MTTARIEAFSDGVIAIIVTIMVLDLKVPADPTPAKLMKMIPSFVSYALSFLVAAIMWVNHHHLIHMAKRADAVLLWSNNNLLFWMSLTPFATAHLASGYTSPLPVATYAVVMTLASLSFIWLRQAVARDHRHDPAFRKSHRRNQVKNLISGLTYAGAAPLAYLHVNAAFFIFVLIPAVYFLPDRSFLEHAE